MIELLNNYRVAKEASEKAATDLGRAFGEAFGYAHPTISGPEIGQFDNLATSDASIDLLRKNLGPQVIGAALADFVNLEGNGYVVGVNLKHETLSYTKANRAPLDEAPFVLGFVEGFKKSRR